MSLSNVLRLYRRRAEAATVHHHADLAALRALYHRHQPFTSTLPRAGALSPQDVPPK